MKHRVGQLCWVILTGPRYQARLGQQCTIIELAPLDKAELFVSRYNCRVRFADGFELQAHTIALVPVDEPRDDVDTITPKELETA